jgi:hypothetical protein
MPKPSSSTQTPRPHVTSSPMKRSWAVSSPLVIAVTVSGEISRTPSSSPPPRRPAKKRAIPAAVPCPFTAGISALRHRLHDREVERARPIPECELTQLVLAPFDLALQVDGPRQLLGSEADVEVERPRGGNLVPPERPQRATVDPADELPAEVAGEERVFAVRRPRLPPGRLGSEQPAHTLPVEQRVCRLRLAESHESCLVAQHLSHRDALLPRLHELGPHAADRIVERTGREPCGDGTPLASREHEAFVFTEAAGTSRREKEIGDRRPQVFSSVWMVSRNESTRSVRSLAAAAS